MSVEIFERPTHITEDLSKKELDKAFTSKKFSLDQRLFKLSPTFDMSDDEGNFLMRAKKKIFQMTREFHLFADKDEEKELLSFKTRGRIPETYDVSDGDDAIGVIKHVPLKSFLHTNWKILSPDEEEEWGTLQRARGFTYEVTTPDGSLVATMKRKLSPLGVKFTMHVPEDEPPIDRRLLVAANIIMAERAFEQNHAGNASGAI